MISERHIKIINKLLDAGVEMQLTLVKPLSRSVICDIWDNEIIRYDLNNQQHVDKLVKKYKLEPYD